MSNIDLNFGIFENLIVGNATLDDFPQDIDLLLL